MDADRAGRRNAQSLLTAICSRMGYLQAVCIENLNPDVMVMKPTKDRG